MPLSFVLSHYCSAVLYMQLHGQRQPYILSVHSSLLSTVLRFYVNIFLQKEYKRHILALKSLCMEPWRSPEVWNSLSLKSTASGILSWLRLRVQPLIALDVPQVLFWLDNGIFRDPLWPVQCCRVARYLRSSSQWEELTEGQTWNEKRTNLNVNETNSSLMTYHKHKQYM